MRLEVERKSHHRSEKGKVVTYRQGESFDGTERELLVFSDRLKASVPDKPKRKAKAGKSASDSGHSNSEQVDHESEQADSTDGY